MTDQNLSKQIYRNLFTEEQWDMIYNFVGNALDDDAELFNPDDVYAIRNKIHALFNWNSLKLKWHLLKHLSHLVITFNLNVVPFIKQIPMAMSTLM